MGPEMKKEGDGHILKAREKIDCCTSHKSPIAGSWKLRIPKTLIEKTTKNQLEGNWED